MNTINKHRLADWSKAPKWATHHSVDADGEGVWNGMELTEEYSMWHRTYRHSAYFDLTGINWRETLESRPDPELPEGMTALMEELQTLRCRLSNKGELQSDPEIELLEQSLLDSHYEHADLLDANKMLKAALKITQDENARLRQQLEFWASQSTLAEIPEERIKFNPDTP